MLVYLNGEYLSYDEARVGVGDRAFLLADGLYEVARVYDGVVFLMEPHLRRMADGLAALRIPFDAVERLSTVAERLLDENELREGDATVYMQITRGEAPRTHAFPKDAVPTVYVQAKPFKKQPASVFEEGVAVITVPDQRWARCDIKTVSLLPNVLANQQAKEAGTSEALLVRDGFVTEGSHTNFFAVFDGVLWTYPAGNYILSGITRGVVLDLAGKLGIPVKAMPISADRLLQADELFLTGTTTEVTPVNKVDGREAGGGGLGPVTKRLQEAFRELI